MVAAEPRGTGRAVDLDGRASSKKTRHRSKKATVASPSPVATPMQRLFDTSREVFSGSSPGFVPPTDAVARLSGLLSTISRMDGHKGWFLF